MSRAAERRVLVAGLRKMGRLVRVCDFTGERFYRDSREWEITGRGDHEVYVRDAAVTGVFTEGSRVLGHVTEEEATRLFVEAGIEVIQTRDLCRFEPNRLAFAGTASETSYHVLPVDFAGGGWRIVSRACCCYVGSVKGHEPWMCALMDHLWPRAYMALAAELDPLGMRGK